MSDQPKPRCDQCHYAVAMAGDTRVRCHRFPPVGITAMNSAWAMPFQNQWCGEFKPREAGKPVPVADAKGAGVEALREGKRKK